MVVHPCSGLFREIMWPQWTVVSYLLSGAAIVSSVAPQKIALLGVWAYLSRRAASFAFDRSPQYCQNDPEILKIGSYVTGFIGSAAVLAGVNLYTKEIDGDEWSAFIYVAEAIGFAGCVVYEIASQYSNRNRAAREQPARVLVV